MAERVIAVFLMLWTMGMFMVVISVVWFLHFTRGWKRLNAWADENGYQILSAQYRFFSRGPFLVSNRTQVVYRVSVRDGQGNIREGWVRFINSFYKTFDGKYEVRWED